MTLRVEPWAQRVETWATENYSHALKPNGVCPVGFQNCLGLVIFFVCLFSFNFLYIVMRMSVIVILCLNHHCILEQIIHFLVYKFTEGEKFCSKKSNTHSLTPTQFRYKWWDLRVLRRWDLEDILDLSWHYNKWRLWGPFRWMDGFCMWTWIFRGQRADCCVPQRCPLSHPLDGECHLMWQTDFADVINLMILRWARLSWISREGICNPKGPTKRRQEDQHQKEKI